MTLVAGSYMGGYEILEQVGHERMATEYRAQRQGLSGSVAMKVVPAYFAEDGRFNDRYQEAVALTKLRHPGLLPVLDYGEGHGMAYLVTPFVGGRPLAERLGQPWSLDDTIGTLTPIAAALDYLHAQGIVHRDVKPTNILIAQDGRPVLSDLGLADVVDRARRVNETGELIGTPAYMAPEQATKEPVSPRTDQYALAVVAYEMLTGRVPFRGATPRDVLLAHRDQAVPAPRQLNPSLPPSTEEALLKGLSKPPRDRYPTVGAFVEALQGIARRADVPGSHATVVDGPVPIPIVPPALPTKLPKGGALVGAMAAGVLLAAVVAGGIVVSHRPSGPTATATATTTEAQASTVTVVLPAPTATQLPATATPVPQCQLAPVFGPLLLVLNGQVQVGACTDAVGLNPSNDDTVQHTTHGLLVQSKADKTLSFTDGYQAWVLGPDGKAHHRLNTQRFPWEANPEGLPQAQP